MLAAIGVLDRNFKAAVTKFTVYMILLERCRYAGTYLYAVVRRLDAQYGLCDGNPVPRCRAREPRVLAFAGPCGLLAGHHLAVHVGFYLVQLLVGYPCRG